MYLKIRIRTERGIPREEEKFESQLQRPKKRQRA